MQTNISPELLAAYKDTRFTALVDGKPIEIRIGQTNSTLDRLLEAKTQVRWAYITASNPASATLSEAVNAERHSQLKCDVAAMGYVFFDGEGIPASSDWKPERSLLILGIHCDAAKQLGRKYGQNAIVVGKLTGAAELVICAEDPLDGNT